MRRPHRRDIPARAGDTLTRRMGLKATWVR